VKALGEIHHVTISAASRWVKEARQRRYRRSCVGFGVALELVGELAKSAAAPATAGVRRLGHVSTDSFVLHD
jgi:hypothetical protein